MSNQLALFEAAEAPVARNMIRVYRFAGVTTTCIKCAQKFATTSEIILVDEYPRSNWYESKLCKCCYDE